MGTNSDSVREGRRDIHLLLDGCRDFKVKFLFAEKYIIREAENMEFNFENQKGPLLLALNIHQK